MTIKLCAYSFTLIGLKKIKKDKGNFIVAIDLGLFCLKLSLIPLLQAQIKVSADVQQDHS